MRILLIVLVAILPFRVRAQQPSSIDPPAGEKRLLQLKGEGVQIYSCASENGAAPAWKFVGPEAKLITEEGSRAGEHYTGPTWKLLDGSEVRGSLVSSKPAAESGAIPWLLLKGAVVSGGGKLRTVEYITRTDTKGGMAPSSGCDAAHQGTQSRVLYTATYTFYGK
jgi:hypothetical protein